MPYVNRVQVFTLLMPFAFYYCLLEKTIHYFMLIQGSPTNGTFEWSSPCCWTWLGWTWTGQWWKWYRGSDTFTGWLHVVTNSNDKERTIPPWYYTLGEIIPILKTMTHTTCSISLMASCNGCIWIQSPHTIHFTNTTDIWEFIGLEGRMIILPASFYESNMIDITRNRQVIQVYSSLDRSSDLKIASQKNNLFTTMIIDDPTTNTINRWKTSAFYW